MMTSPRRSLSDTSLTFDPELPCQGQRQSLPPEPGGGSASEGCLSLAVSRDPLPRDAQGGGQPSHFTVASRGSGSLTGPKPHGLQQSILSTAGACSARLQAVITVEEAKEYFFI